MSNKETTDTMQRRAYVEAMFDWSQTHESIVPDAVPLTCEDGSYMPLKDYEEIVALIVNDPFDIRGFYLSDVEYRDYEDIDFEDYDYEANGCLPDDDDDYEDDEYEDDELILVQPVSLVFYNPRVDKEFVVKKSKEGKWRFSYSGMYEDTNESVTVFTDTIEEAIYDYYAEDDIPDKIDLSYLFRGKDYCSLDNDEVRIPKSDITAIQDLINNDGYNVKGFHILELYPDIFRFENCRTDEYFNVIKEDDGWHFAYFKRDGNLVEDVLANSIAEAVDGFKQTDWSN